VNQKMASSPVTGGKGSPPVFRQDSLSVITAEEEQTDRPRYAFLVGMVPYVLLKSWSDTTGCTLLVLSFMGFD